MKVSVLLLTYNQERYVAQAIDSALMQNASFDFELVISEDCSTDHTRSIVQDYEARYPGRIRARYSPHNLGGVTSFALTYHQCSGQYVALLDGDDYWTSPAKLQKQADFLDQHPDCSMCTHGMVVIRQGSDQQPVAWTPEKEVLSIEDLILNNFIYTGSAMLRKEVFNDHPPWVYDAPFSDYPLWFKAAQHGRIGYIQGFLGVYRVHDTGAWSGKSVLAQVNDMISFYERMRQEVDPGYDHLFERVLARFYGQLACERAGVPMDAHVLVASGGDSELLKVRPGARHFPQQADGAGVPLPRRKGELAQLLEGALAEGAQFLLVPRTALSQLRGYPVLRRLLLQQRCRDLNRRHRPIWDGPEALIYALGDRTPKPHARAAGLAQTVQ